MWGMAPLHHFNRSAKYEALGRPLKQIIPFVDLKEQGELAGPVKIPEKLRKEFYLGDFSLAAKLDTDHAIQAGYPPLQFCSPDRLHGEKVKFCLRYMELYGYIY